MTEGKRRLGCATAPQGGVAKGGTRCEFKNGKALH